MGMCACVLLINWLHLRVPPFIAVWMHPVDRVNMGTLHTTGDEGGIMSRLYSIYGFKSSTRKESRCQRNYVEQV